MVQFKEGYQYDRTSLHGMNIRSVVRNRIGNKVLVSESWIAEDTGEDASANTWYDVKTDGDKEYIVVWRYKGEEGRVYAARDKKEAQ